MRILLLAPHPFFQHRGTPIAERALLEFLTGEGHEVDVLTYHEGEDVDLAGCRVFRIPPLPGIRNLRPGFSFKKLLCDVFLLGRAAGLMRRGRYDLVHAVEESVFMAAVLGKIFRVPYIYDMDSSLAEQMIERYPVMKIASRALHLTERQAIRRSLGVLAVCRSVEEVARHHDPDQLIARVEDSTLLRGEHDQLEATVPAGGPVVMYVGNLEKYQGIDLLLDSFALVQKRRPDARLFIVGGQSSSIAAYGQRAEALGIADRVSWAGPQPVERLGDWLRRADVLVSPRLTGRNTPMKVYSYLDSGRPVVATRIPTHTQVLDDEIACLVEPDAKSLADSLVQLLDDPVRRHALAQRARERVQALYTPAAAALKLRAFYAAVEAGLRRGDPAA
jgi:glycosyltransferase involved in cell wall biosynthesis